METPFIRDNNTRTISKKATLIALLAVVGCVCAFYAFQADGTQFAKKKDVLQDVWQDWKVQYGKQYGGPEEKVRYNIFKTNYNFIQTTNAADRKYKLGLNQFADLSSEEFKAIYTGARVNNTNADCPAPSLLAAAKTAAPTTVDWRTKNVLPAVKNQGQCGSCWAFSTVGSLEALHAIKTGQVVAFSEQQLVDCSGDFGNFGCNGGWVQNAYHYIEKNGIMTEADYPYKAVDGKCKYDAKKAVNWKLEGCVNVATSNVDALKQAIAQGPVSVYVEADQRVFQFYKTGILDDASCFTEGEIDHAVLAVGYTDQYWIVRNSWGPTWGDKGYINIAIDPKYATGVCGILSTPDTYPIA